MAADAANRYQWEMFKALLRCRNATDQEGRQMDSLPASKSLRLPADGDMTVTVAPEMKRFHGMIIFPVCITPHQFMPTLGNIQQRLPYLRLIRRPRQQE